MKEGVKTRAEPEGTGETQEVSWHRLCRGELGGSEELHQQKLMKNGAKLGGQES